MKTILALLLLIPSLAWNVSKAGYEPSNEHKEKELREYCRVIHSEIEYSIRNYVNDKEYMHEAQDRETRSDYYNSMMISENIIKVKLPIYESLCNEHNETYR